VVSYVFTTGRMALSMGAYHPGTPLHLYVGSEQGRFILLS